MVCVSGLVLVLGLKPSVRHPLMIRFRNCVGNRPLALTGELYSNSFGESFSVQQFKYYVSAVRVGDGGDRGWAGEEGSEGVDRGHTDEGEGSEVILKEAHLVDEGDSSSLVLHLSTDLADVRTISFVVGVDSLANTGGVQGGDLDPMLGMFWTWNTGYIYARLEGESDSAHSPAHRFTWDIGGYKDPSNALRTVTLALGGARGDGARDDGAMGGEVIWITADVLKWFDGKSPVHLAGSPICHQPGALAMRIADNYSTMFSVTP
jgi:hypothetical protein